MSRLAAVVAMAVLNALYNTGIFTTPIVWPNSPTLDETSALVVGADNNHIHIVKGAPGRKLPILDATPNTEPLQGVATSRCSSSRVGYVAESALRQDPSTGIASRQNSHDKFAVGVVLNPLIAA